MGKLQLMYWVLMVLPLILQILKRLKMIHGITHCSHIIVVQVNTVVLVLVCYTGLTNTVGNNYTGEGVVVHYNIHGNTDY